MHAGGFALDEFDRAVPGSFLPSRQATNVLNCLSSDPVVKQEITRNVVTSVALRDPKFLKTEFHVSWVMECLGYAFSLPIDHHEVIQKAVQVYTAWLTPMDRPECIAGNEGFYQREILCHFSLLFVERHVYPIGGMQKHTDLCKATLHAMRSLALRSDLSTETWNTLLKVLLLISKPLLSPITPRDLTTHLSPLLLRVLLELWLRSNTREQSLWLELQECIAMWTHHVWLVRHWGAIVHGLTRRVISFLYAFGPQKVKIQFNTVNPIAHADPLELDLPIEQVVYFWYYFLSIMLNNTKDQPPDNPEIHYELARKVSSLVECFLEVCTARNDSRNMESPAFAKNLPMPGALSSLYKEFEKQHFQYLTSMARLPIPSADGVFGLFGSWLFAHAGRGHGSEQGRAESIGAICRVITQAAGPVSDDYLARFYSVTGSCLQFQGTVASAFIRYSKGLLTRQYKGIRQLLVLGMIPNAVEKFLKDTNPDTRKDCYTILGSYVALPYYYLSLPFLTNQTRIPQLFTQIYENLGSNVKDVLLQALDSEKDSELLRTLCWLVCVYLTSSPNAEDLLSDDLDNYVRFVSGIAGRLEGATEWQASSDLVEVLTALAHLLRSKNIGDTRFVVGPLVMQLCQLIEARANNELQVSALIMCLLAWLMNFPTVFQDLGVRNRCLQVTSKSVLKDICLEGPFLQQYLLTRLGLQLPPFQFGHGQDIVLSISSPKLTAQVQDLPCKHYLISTDALVSIYDSSQFNGKADEAVVVVRDCMGRYAWKAQIEYSHIEQKSEEGVQLFPVRVNCRSSIVMEEPDLHTEAVLISQLTDTEQDDFSRFSQLIKKQKDIDSSFLSSPASPPSHPSDPTPPSKPLSKSHRMLLSSLGLLSLSTSDSLSVIEGQEVTSAIRTLDRLPERDSYYLTVLYLQFPEIMDTTLGKGQYSASFQTFMRNMGVKVTAENGLQATYEHLSELVENIGAVLYTGDVSYEFLTISPTIMPAEKLRGFSNQRLTQYGEVVLLWNERSPDPYSDKKPQILENSYIKKLSVIIVSPLGNGLCHIQLALKRYTPGPLQDCMVLPETHLAQLVIRTVISIVGSVHTNRTALVKRRRETLEELAMKNKRGNRVERVATTFVQTLRG